VTWCRLESKVVVNVVFVRPSTELTLSISRAMLSTHTKWIPAKRAFSSSVRGRRILRSLDERRDSSGRCGCTLGPVDGLGRVTMQVFVRDHCAMIQHPPNVTLMEYQGVALRAPEAG
jgi:hypothetical protein